MRRGAAWMVVIGASLAGPAPIGCGARSDPLAFGTDGVAGEDAGGDARVLPPSDAAAPPDAGGPPAVGCNVVRARVFVTAAMSGPSFGGVSGADAACTAHAHAQGLGGKWRAWLGDSRTPASVHVYRAPGGYALLDGTVVATSASALVSGSLAHAIDLTESRKHVTDGNTEVWTGSDATGSGGGVGFCADGAGHDWSSADVGAPTPFVGHEDATDATWTAAYLQFCNRTNVRLYCFEGCD